MGSAISEQRSEVRSDVRQEPDDHHMPRIGGFVLRLAQDFRERAKVEYHARGHTEIRQTYHSVIAHLPNEGLRLTELAERAQLTKQAVGQLVDDLERMGYVERLPDPEDGRAKLICFTKLGHELLADTEEILDQIWSFYAGLVGQERLAELRHSLEALVTAVDRNEQRIEISSGIFRTTAK